MKTIEISKQEMSKRVARYADLDPLPIQTDSGVPVEITDQVSARELLSVIGLDSADETPINAGAPITGAGGMTITIARCPAGQGPCLHAHNQTYETFTVLKGQFEITWNNEGDESVILEQFDTISVPPGVCRAFRNVSDQEGLLQVVITGGVHDMADIDLSPSVGEMLERTGYIDKFEGIGYTFTAGVPD